MIRREIHRRACAALVFITAAALLAGCSTPRLGPTALEQIEDLSGDPEVALGRQVFMTHCYQCHPGGAAGLGPGITHRQLPAFMIRTQVRVGLGAMPSFSEEAISEEEAHAVAKYIKALSQIEPENPGSQ